MPLGRSRVESMHSRSVLDRRLKLSLTHKMVSSSPTLKYSLSKMNTSTDMYGREIRYTLVMPRSRHLSFLSQKMPLRSELRMQGKSSRTLAYSSRINMTN